MKRIFLGKISPPVELPNLIEVQTKSYNWLLEKGIKELFEEISPIYDWTEKELKLEFLNYYLDEPKYSEEASREHNISYEAPLRVNTRLTKLKEKEIIEHEIYLGDLPLMTERGTFIINGVERVVVSQLIRSPGAFFTATNLRGRFLFGAKIIPNRGAWLELETEQNGAIMVRIDRKRKVAVTALLRAFGYSRDDQIKRLFVLLDTNPNLSFIKATFDKDASHSSSEGLIEVYKRIRPGDLATVDNARQMIEGMFFNFNRYDFGRVGRYKLNQLFNENLSTDNPELRILRKEDLVNAIKEIIKRNNDPKAHPDDIDHLGNRRVRTLGELIQNKLRVGLMRMERNIKDRMSTLDVGSLQLPQLINAKPLVAVVREFFASSQLSQFMDQVNPLAELEHKRRLSAMGPGGLARERAGFEVRDVHPSHYGRICPIQTPEGQNIGLIGHMASYTRINEYGFLETPYRKVKKGSSESTPRVSDEIIYLDATQEEKTVIAHANVPLDSRGHFLESKVPARIKGEAGIVKPQEVDYVDISPNQSISIATALIPFLEHNAANRALMGSNMQRQAVSCIRPQSPIVGTGVEAKAAFDSGQVILAKTGGVILEVDASHIVIKGKNTIRYKLKNFAKSNADTCINQQPRVKKYQRVKTGELLADGAATSNGELSLGQNLLAAFMCWEGANYEDAVVISEKLVKDDRYTSIHIEDYSVDVRETKLGPEIITQDIPNIGEEKLANLDEEGIVRIGAEVRTGDILVGKISPKGESDLSAEERLLKAIFGEKARDVKDASLLLPHGKEGRVVGIRIFSRERGDKLPSDVTKTIQVSVAQMRKIAIGDKTANRHGNKGIVSRILPEEDMPCLACGTPIDIILSPLGVTSRMNIGQILETHLGWAAKILGFQVASPALAGISEEVIKSQLKRAGLPEGGKVVLYDGRTGKAFDQKITVGFLYMMKLNHLVEDKIHARSVGPYSLITQQPLGGKAQGGGQRFGEMEVWALEAYGAAHTLQEMLTIKSDDVLGRAKAYDSIIKGEFIRKPNIPASFDVLVNELKALALDVEFI